MKKKCKGKSGFNLCTGKLQVRRVLCSLLTCGERRRLKERENRKQSNRSIDREIAGYESDQEKEKTQNTVRSGDGDRVWGSVVIMESVVACGVPDLWW